MKTAKRQSAGTHFSMCVQPAFIVGTSNDDGTYHFAPITWVSVTNEKENDYLLTISMFGAKRTKQNVMHRCITFVQPHNKRASGNSFTGCSSFPLA